ncbi:SWIM zinc finger family protein [Streptomyces sp. MA5143a]|uniref:SWIM zinc finger family protein n=1 Tax=Streptomyces sp. MA5143a TaxID=2083010 RepID=UPI0035C1DA8C
MTSGRGSAGSEVRGARGARPGDVARAALWRATGARAAASPQEPSGERVSHTPEAPRAGGTAAPGGARPGDIARAALRAARSAAERARAEAEEESKAKADTRARTDADAVADAGAEARIDADVDAVADVDAGAGVRGAVSEASAASAASAAAGAAGAGQRAAPSPRAADRAPGRRSGRLEGRGRSADRGEGADPSEGPRPVRDVRAVLAGAFELPSEDLAPRAEAEPPTRGEADAHVGDRSVGRVVDHPGETRSGGGGATPLVPGTMAAPSRDGELRRTFGAFPPRTSGGEAFAESWWGNAWVTALEEGALDAARLTRGRAYADKGNVDAITVTPGLVLAYVHGSRPRPYRVQVRLRTLDDDEWDSFLDTAAERPADIAALLDKELPQSLAGGATPSPAPASGGRSPRGTRLLPGPGELEPHCSCPDRGHPCKHAAALCYQTARLLDEDPFVLLLLRGRGERELLDALSRRNAARAARAAQEQRPTALPGVRASEALSPRTLPPLPAPLPPPPHPEQPPVYPGAPGGPDPFALDQLATDAAARAHALLTTGRDPVAELTLWQDAVRLAAARPGSGLTATTRALYSSLAAATGRTAADLARAVAAWRQGGIEGLAVLEEPWDPPAGRFDRARPLLLAADLPAFRPWHNHLTHPLGHVQLRLGRDGLWYAYESDPGHDDWWPRGTPDLDPVGALTGLGSTDGL